MAVNCCGVNIRICQRVKLAVMFVPHVAICFIYIAMGIHGRIFLGILKLNAGGKKYR